jgi:hypothetical protein
MAENRGVVFTGAGNVPVQNKAFAGMETRRGKRIGQAAVLRGAAPAILGYHQHMTVDATRADQPCQAAAVRQHFSDWLCLCLLTAAQAYAKGCFVCVEPEALEPDQEAAQLHGR